VSAVCGGRPGVQPGARRSFHTSLAHSVAHTSLAESVARVVDPSASDDAQTSRAQVGDETPKKGSGS
jgi:hypothetical protein